MRLINLLRIHFRIFFHKNLRNCILLITESSLMVAFLAMFTSNLFLGFEYKMNYIDKESISLIAFLSLNNSIVNQLSISGNRQHYNDLIEKIKGETDICDVGAVKQYNENIGGVNALCVTYENFMANDIRQPTINGKWIDMDENVCVIGGSLCEIYNIGDTLELDTGKYKIIDYLSEPFYYIDSYVGGVLSIYLTLSETDNLVITESKRNTDIIYSSLILGYKDSEMTFEELKQTCSKYGTLYSIDDMLANTAGTRNQMVYDELPLFIVLILICVLISVSGILISSQRNLADNAVMLLVGETKGRMVMWNSICYGLMLLIGWNIGICLASYLGAGIVAIPGIVREAKVLTVLITVGLFIVSMTVITIVYHRDAIRIYQSER